MNHSKHATGKRAMVVSGHDKATQAAIAVLERGGSIADAALAGAAVLSVVLPHACGLGGDAFVLVHDAASGKTLGLNASGRSPALAQRSSFPDGLQERGPLSCNVPGMIAGWQALHDRYGRLPWAELLGPAIGLAHDGFGVSPVLAKASALHRHMLNEDSRTLFLPDGVPLLAGQTLRQPQAAQTLQAIAREGGASFYQGAIGASVARACQAAGGLIRESDLRAYAPEWVEPIETGYAGHVVRTMPPNSYGLYLLLQLMALEASQDKGGKGLDAPARITKLIRAAQAAFQVGARAVADPDPRYGTEPARLLLGPEGARRLRTAMGGKPGNLGGTAVISVADHQGNAVTIIQSVFLVFGSGVSDAETGVLLNNRLFGFTMEPGHPNEVGPNKYPAHTLCPAMVFRDGRLRYAVTTPGGPGQTLTLAQVMQAMFEEGATLAQAIQAPRWTMDLAGHSLFEHTMPEQVVRGVQALGEPMKAGEPGSPYFGSVKGIALEEDGTLVGAADHRRDATVRGLS
ncbi:gamma-glutamyltransferase [Orrella sp. JC864]|uniref:gamma-glutamyltransferase family protein n=1 Tax=Orrella sp. JC864 TaxID=3120298 RepID=UPI0030087BC3